MYPDVQLYIDGEWSNGEFHGYGVYATIDGDLYSGKWSMGKRNGQGVQVWSDGRIYQGTFRNDDRHGDGVMTWPYGAHYTGQFECDKRNGKGSYTYADGRYYVGHYQDERPHGYGVLKTSIDGTILYDGMWRLGEFLGSGTTDERTCDAGNKKSVGGEQVEFPATSN